VARLQGDVGSTRTSDSRGLTSSGRDRGGFLGDDTAAVRKYRRSPASSRASDAQSSDVLTWEIDAKLFDQPRASVAAPAARGAHR